MVLPAMVYKSDGPETIAHFRAVARSSGLPILVYNNPVAYGVDITPEMFAELSDERTLVAIKESSGNVRRVTDLFNAVGDRYTIFCGVDDLIMESVLLGAQGWVAGLGLAFPREKPAPLGPDDGRPVGRGAGDLPLVHPAPAPRYADQVRPVHQARRAGVRPGRRVGQAATTALGRKEREDVLGIIRRELRTGRSFPRDAECKANFRSIFPWGAEVRVRFDDEQ